MLNVPDPGQGADTIIGSADPHASGVAIIPLRPSLVPVGGNRLCVAVRPSIVTCSDNLARSQGRRKMKDSRREANVL